MTTEILEDRIISIQKHQGLRGHDDYLNVSQQIDETSTQNFNVLQREEQRWRRIIEIAEERSIDVIEVPRLNEPNGEGVLRNYPHNSTLNDDTVLWRYMNVSQFLNLLTTASIWLSRADVLQKSDPFEGRVPIAQRNAERAYYHHINWADVRDIHGSLYFTQTQRAQRQIEMSEQMAENQKFHTYINCWNIEPVENAAMWKVYGKEHNAVAIKTTLGRLRSALGNNKDYKIEAGKISYIDFSSDALERPTSQFEKFFTKSEFYRSEGEFRLLFHDWGEECSLFTNSEKFIAEPNVEELDEMAPGLNVPVDIKELIQSLVIGPDSDPWLLESLNTIAEPFLPGIRFENSVVKQWVGLQCMI